MTSPPTYNLNNQWDYSWSDRRSELPPAKHWYQSERIFRRVQYGFAGLSILSSIASGVLFFTFKTRTVVVISTLASAVVFLVTSLFMRRKKKFNNDPVINFNRAENEYQQQRSPKDLMPPEQWDKLMSAEISKGFVLFQTRWLQDNVKELVDCLDDTNKQFLTFKIVEYVHKDQGTVESSILTALDYTEKDVLQYILECEKNNPSTTYQKLQERYDLVKWLEHPPSFKDNPQLERLRGLFKTHISYMTFPGIMRNYNNECTFFELEPKQIALVLRNYQLKNLKTFQDFYRDCCNEDSELLQIVCIDMNPFDLERLRGTFYEWIQNKPLNETRNSIAKPEIVKALKRPPKEAHQKILKKQVQKMNASNDSSAFTTFMKENIPEGTDGRYELGILERCERESVKVKLQQDETVLSLPLKAFEKQYGPIAKTLEVDIETTIAKRQFEKWKNRYIDFATFVETNCPEIISLLASEERNMLNDHFFSSEYPTKQKYVDFLQLKRQEIQERRIKDAQELSYQQFLQLWGVRGLTSLPPDKKGLLQASYREWIVEQPFSSIKRDEVLALGLDYNGVLQHRWQKKNLLLLNPSERHIFKAKFSDGTFQPQDWQEQIAKNLQSNGLTSRWWQKHTWILHILPPTTVISADGKTLIDSIIEGINTNAKQWTFKNLDESLIKIPQSFHLQIEQIPNLLNRMIQFFSDISITDLKKFKAQYPTLFILLPISLRKEITAIIGQLQEAEQNFDQNLTKLNEVQIQALAALSNKPKSNLGEETGSTEAGIKDAHEENQRSIANTYRIEIANIQNEFETFLNEYRATPGIQ